MFRYIQANRPPAGQQPWLALSMLILALQCGAPQARADTPGAQAGFNAMDGGHLELIIAVGNRGIIAHFTQSTGWQPKHSGTLRDLHGVHIVSPEFAVAAGEGIVMRWDGRHWDTLFEEETGRKYSRVWASADHQLVIFGGEIDGENWICPWKIGADRQPFCRQFKAPLAGVCGNNDDVHIVLANGDIYEVNSALMSKDANFEPASVSDVRLELLSAVHVGENCGGGFREPTMIAIEKDMGLLVLYQGRWLPVKTVPPEFINGEEVRAALMTALAVSR